MKKKEKDHSNIDFHPNIYCLEYAYVVYEKTPSINSVCPVFNLNHYVIYAAYFLCCYDLAMDATSKKFSNMKYLITI